MQMNHNMGWSEIKETVSNQWQTQDEKLNYPPTNQHTDTHQHIT